jgi:hypothetical protein
MNKSATGGDGYSIYVHSTPVFQEGDLLWLHETYCPYPIAAKTSGIHIIETNEAELRNSRFNYYIGAASRRSELNTSFRLPLATIQIPNYNK